jgi:hypothetical protein
MDALDRKTLLRRGLLAGGGIDVTYAIWGPWKSVS